MREPTKPADLRQLRVLPLAQRRSLTRVEEILADPDGAPPSCPARAEPAIKACAEAIRQAADRNATVLLMYGAHLLRNGAAPLLGRMMQAGWVTHLATNGAGSIHDWEYAWLGRSTESVRENVRNGTFGAWDETGRFIQTALLAGALQEQGYGAALGRFIAEDGVTLPDPAALRLSLREHPDDPLAPARAELLQAMVRHGLPGGPHRVTHRWKHASILAQAYAEGIPMTVHPGIGYDIIACHPLYSGAAVGRAAALDFALLCGSVDQLDGGVALSIGSAIMAPQVFEKSVSCVNNLRLQAGRPVLAGHRLFVVDLQDGGGWDWSAGEPPKSNPAYYLRFCKRFSRMGGEMSYAQCDNLTFVHQLYHRLRAADAGSPP